MASWSLSSKKNLRRPGLHYESWSAPDGQEEWAAIFGDAAAPTVLVLPAWFDESNKLRHLTIEAMRKVAARGVRSVLPDLPGMNESLAAIETQTLEGWRAAAAQAVEHFGATHILAIRASAAIAPDLPGWDYAPLAPAKQLRAMLRAEVIVRREYGEDVTRDGLLEQGCDAGLTIAGYRLGPQLVSDLSGADSFGGDRTAIKPADLGGPGLWLRAEPGHDAAQSEALARIVGKDLAS